MAEQEAPKAEPELQVDPHATDMLKSMGVPEPFPPEIVERYNVLKRFKDLVHPGRLSVEMFALIVAETVCAPEQE